jgi:hypothetical protein
MYFYQQANNKPELLNRNFSSRKPYSVFANSLLLQLALFIFYEKQTNAEENCEKKMTNRPFTKH